MLISKQGSRRLLLIFIFQLNSFSSRFMFVCWYFWHNFYLPSILLQNKSKNSSFMLNHLRLIFLSSFYSVFFMYVNWILGFMSTLKGVEQFCEFGSIYLYLIVPSYIIEICLFYFLRLSMIIPTSPFPCITIRSKYSTAREKKLK